MTAEYALIISFLHLSSGLDLYELQRLSRDLTHHEKRPDFMQVDLTALHCMQL